MKIFISPHFLVDNFFLSYYDSAFNATFLYITRFNLA